MSNWVLSGCKDGYVLKRDAKIVEGKWDKTVTRDGEPRIRILKYLSNGVERVRSKLDHDSLVIEVDSSYVYSYLSEENTKAAVCLDEIYSLRDLIEECDAVVKFVKVDKSFATKYIGSQSEDKGAFGFEATKLSVMSISDAFEDLD